MRVPALALVGASGRIQCSTESFRSRVELTAELCDELPELEAVLTGQASQATISLDELQALVEAVVDVRGNRCALMTLPAESAATSDDLENAILREQLDDSPAIVWLKDRDGRHMRVNQHFVTFLRNPEDEIRGRTDAELPPAGTVDGPRLEDPEIAMPEPIEFEYTVPAYKERPPLAVVRFSIHARDGESVGVCGVAAPLAKADVARAEAERLIRIERWSFLDPESIRAELLEEWGVRIDEEPVEGLELTPQEFDGEPRPTEPLVTEVERIVYIERDGDGDYTAALDAATAARDDATARRDQAIADRDEALAAREGLEQQRQSLEAQLDQARRAAERHRSELEAARDAVSAARAETDRTRSGSSASAGELAQARREAQQLRAQVALAQKQLEVPRCTAAAQASKPSSSAAQPGIAVQVPVRQRQRQQPAQPAAPAPAPRSAPPPAPTPAAPVAQPSPPAPAAQPQPAARPQPVTPPQPAPAQPQPAPTQPQPAARPAEAQPAPQRPSAPSAQPPPVAQAPAYAPPPAKPEHRGLMSRLRRRRR
ncbi:MAG TPA: PAS domain-containing protein [Solirubrobacteraceae bacterium]